MKCFFTFCCCVKMSGTVGVVKGVVSHQREYGRVVEVAHSWETQGINEKV